jgi:hypothetical protein
MTPNLGRRIKRRLLLLLNMLSKEYMEIVGRAKRQSQQAKLGPLQSHLVPMNL